MVFKHIRENLLVMAEKVYKKLTFSKHTHFIPHQFRKIPRIIILYLSVTSNPCLKESHLLFYKLTAILEMLNKQISILI